VRLFDVLLLRVEQNGVERGVDFILEVEECFQVVSGMERRAGGGFVQRMQQRDGLAVDDGVPPCRA
jgi:hypothetical protein